MKKTTLLLIFALTGNFLFAQSYNTVGGLRLGFEMGLTAKHRILKNTAIEGIIQNDFRSDLTSVTILLEQHQKILTRRFNMYVGAGVHKGWLTDSRLDFKNPSGLTLIGGIDFTVKRWNLSYDIKPAINIYGGQNTFDVDSSFSLRYVLIPRDSKVKRFFKEKKWKFWKKKKRN